MIFSPKYHAPLSRRKCSLRLIPESPELRKLGREFNHDITDGQRLREHVALRPYQPTELHRGYAILQKKGQSALNDRSNSSTQDKQNTYLDPRNQMLHELQQHAVRHLAASVLDTIQDPRLRRAQTGLARRLDGTAQHLEP